MHWFTVFVVFMVAGCTDGSSPGNERKTTTTPQTKPGLSRATEPLKPSKTDIEGQARPSCKQSYIKYRDTPVCLDRDFQYFSTTGSSWVNGAWYDAKNQYLVIGLRGTLYHYCRFDEGTWNRFRRADSYGRFYLSSIKGRFDCRAGGVPEYETGR
jgi:hypothetical protein